MSGALCSAVSEAMSERRRALLARGCALAALIGHGVGGSRAASAGTLAGAVDDGEWRGAARSGAPQFTSDVVLGAPDLVENGAYVPLTVDCRLADVQRIAIVVESNPIPLAASFHIAEGTEAFVATRVKMAETGRVVALVEAGGRLYAAERRVEVSVGGCQ